MNNEISVLITGDYHPTNKLTNFISKGATVSDVFGALLPLIQTSDLSIAHLEIPVTNSNIKFKKGGLYGKTDKTCIKLLRDAGFDLCTYATNHSLDYGVEGFYDTINNCNEFGIDIVGAGNNMVDATKPYINEINNIKFAVLNYTETEFNIANENSPGSNPLDLIQVYRDVENLKPLVNHIIVIIHGGQDYTFHPSPRMVRNYRFIADLNVSCIIGHHTHYISSSEIYNNVPIIYSLGHLIYYYTEKDIFTRLFNVASVKLTKENCKVDLHPFYFNSTNNCIQLLDNTQRKLFSAKQNELNNDILNDSLNYEKWYLEISKENVIRNLTILSNIPQIIFRIFKKMGKLTIYKKLILLNKRRFLPIWNISRCPRHLASISYLFESKLYNKK
jgi:poly-gamma-glutamate synthesis protein (capsule biosynthesis protein)